MNIPDDEKRELLRLIPQVNELVDAANNTGDFEEIPRPVLLQAVRRVLAAFRELILSNEDAGITARELEMDSLLMTVTKRVEGMMGPSLRRVINATGVVLHTNLGRAPLSPGALDAVTEISRGYCNLEYRLVTGDRYSRQEHLDMLLCWLTGAESALVVNNNAAAVLLVLAALARGREVIVSRGQLVEIGDSFRLPDIMRHSGAVLKEVGTTNRTSLADYGNAIGPETAMLMRVHPSNFRIMGYTEEVPLRDLVGLGRQSHIPVVEDLGSGSLVELDPHGLPGEHTAGVSVAEGADLVTFSADKLLGGPQAGIIVGSDEYVVALRKHPLARALRVDKMVIAALEATLRDYLDPESAWDKVPALRMMAESEQSVRKRARRLERILDKAGHPGLDYAVVRDVSRVGGGTLPLAEIPSYCLSVSHSGLSPSKLEELLRNARPPVVGRLKEDRLLLDLRTVRGDEVSAIGSILAGLP